MTTLSDRIRQMFEPTTLVFTVKRPWWRFWQVEKWRAIKFNSPEAIRSFLAIEHPGEKINAFLDVWNSEKGERIDMSQVNLWWLESDRGIPFPMEGAFGYGPASKEYQDARKEATAVATEAREEKGEPAAA